MRPVYHAKADRFVSKAGDLQRLMVEAKIGARLPLTVIRGDNLITLDVIPVELS